MSYNWGFYNSFRYNDAPVSLSPATPTVMVNVNPVPKVELSTVDPSGTPVKVDISTFVIDNGIQTNRGRSSELDRFQAGTATIQLNNQDGRFDPNYAGVLVNLASNPSVEVDLSGYTGLSSAISRQTGAAAVVGTYGLQTITTNVGTSGWEYSPAGGGIPVTPGIVYDFSLTARLAAAGSQPMFMAIFWFTSGAAFISASAVGITLTPTSTRFELVGSSPAAAAFAKLYIYTQAPQGVFTFYMDALQFEQIAPPHTGTARNLIKNPSVETDLVGYTATLSTNVRSGGAAVQFGAFGIQTSVTNVINSGVTWDKDQLAGLIGATGVYTASLYARKVTAGTVNFTMQIHFYNGSTFVNAVGAACSVTTTYTRFSVTGTAGAGTDRAYVFFLTSSAQGVFDIYTDGWQFEFGSVATAYNDGDQPNGHWSGIPHASYSVFGGTYVASAYADGSLDNHRWVGTAHASASYRGGPFYPNLRPMNRVWISDVWNAVNYPKFTGYTTEWKPVYTDQGAQKSVVNLPLTDAFSVLSIPVLSMVPPYVDDATTNLLQNTSIEDDIDQYGAYTATVSQSTEQFFLGDKSLKLTTTNVADSHARYEKDDNITVIPGMTYTFSVYAMLAVAAAKNFLMRIDFWNGAAFVNSVAANAPMSDTDWHRFSVCGVAGPLADRAYLVFGTSSAQGIFDVYLDCWQFEQLLTNITEMPAERSDLRAHRVLDAIGWPAGDRVISVGASTLVKQEELSGVATLTYLQTIEQSENGLLYIDKSGRLVLASRWDRFLPPYDTSQATFGQLGTDLRYLNVTPSLDLTFIKNDIRLTGTQPNAVEQVAGDATSVGHYYTRTLQISGLLISDNEAATADAYLLARYKDFHQRIVSLECAGMLDPDNQWPALLGRELGDRITVKFFPLNEATELAQECFIEGMQLNWTRSDFWRVTFQLSAFGIGTAVYPPGKSFFEINHATRGKLDTGTGVLVY